MRKLLSMLVAVGALAVPATATADPGNGAQHFEEVFCETNPDYATACFNQQFVVNRTENENNISMFVHLQYQFSFTGLGQNVGCSRSTDGSAKQHVLFKKDTQEAQVEHYRYQFDVVAVQCGQTNVNLRCTEEGAWHYANGELRHESGEYVCEPT